MNATSRLTYPKLIQDVLTLLQQARHQAARSVNVLLVATHWEIGRRIVEHEQGGKARAEYGEALLDRMAEDLTSRLGRGFSRQNLQQMRQFYLTYPSAGIRQTVSGKLDATSLSKNFSLSWSHYVHLMETKSPQARAFYETEALRGGWSVRQLERTRLALSRRPPKNRAGQAR